MEDNTVNIRNEEVINENGETVDALIIEENPSTDEEPKQNNLLTGIIGVGAVVGAGYGLYRLGKKVFKTTKTFVAGGVQAVREDAARDDEPDAVIVATDLDTGEEVEVAEVFVEEPKKTTKAKKESK